MTPTKKSVARKTNRKTKAATKSNTSVVTESVASVSAPNVEPIPVVVPEAGPSAASESTIHQRSNKLLILALILGWTLDFLFWKQAVGVNFTLFISLCLLGGFYWLFSNGLRPAQKALWLLVPIVFFVVITFLRQEPLTIFLAYTFTLFSAGLLANTLIGGHWIQYGLLDYFNKFLQLLGNMIVGSMYFISDVRKDQANREKPKNSFPVWPLLRGLVIALPIVVCFATLLASGDVVFNQKLGDFFDLFDSAKISEYIFRGILILLYAYLLGGALLHATSKSRDEKLIGEGNPVIKPFLGFTESTVVLGSVSILFLVFVIIQFQYFFGGQTNIGVTGYTYSQYARRGFNELITVAFFSLVMILGLSTLTRRENDTQRRVYSALSVAVVALVMVILVSAYQRISLGIDWHGFSRYRLYPRVFLIWLGILLVAVAALEIFQRERYFAFAAVLASLGFAVSLTLVNVDAATVKHNVFRAWHGRNLNVPHLASLSADAVPALADEFFASSLPTATREGVGAILLCYMQSDLSKPPENWRSFNLSRWRAFEALNKVRPHVEGYSVNDKQWPVRVRTPGNVLYECWDGRPFYNED